MILAELLGGPRDGLQVRIDPDCAPPAILHRPDEPYRFTLRQTGDGRPVYAWDPIADRLPT